MAGTSTKTTVVGVRVPNDTLAEWQSVNTDGGSMAAFVLDRAMGLDAAEVEMAAANERAAGAEHRVAELEALVVKLESDVAFWKRVPRPQPPVPSAPKTQEKIDPRVHHMAGPVLANAAPSRVAGNVPWSNLKRGKSI